MFFRKASMLMIFLTIVRSDVAVDREIEGDLLQQDAGMGNPFRPGTFDGAIRWEGYIELKNVLGCLV